MNLSAISREQLVGRLLRWPLRLVPRHAVLPILQGRLRGKRWTVGSSTHGCWLGSYEIDKRKLIETLVQPGEVFYDLGAHAGYYTMLAAELVGPSGLVAAFEPVPENARNVRRHLQLNGYENVRLEEAAVSDHSGTASFAPNVSSSMGKLSESGDLTVRTIAIDGLVAEGRLPPPDLLKIDIEGGEHAALLGMSTTLATRHPTILLATHGRDIHLRCLELLRGLGYEVRSLDPRDSVDETDELVATFSDDRS